MIRYAIIDDRGLIIQTGMAPDISDMQAALQPGESLVDISLSPVEDTTGYWYNMDTGHLEQRPEIPMPIIQDQSLRFPEPLPPDLRAMVYDIRYGGYPLTASPVSVPGNIWFPQAGEYRVELSAEFPYQPRSFTAIFANGITPVITDKWIELPADLASQAAYIGTYRAKIKQDIHDRMAQVWGVISTTDPWDESALAHLAIQAYSYLIDPNGAANAARYPVLQDSWFGPTMQTAAENIIAAAKDLTTIIANLIKLYRSTVFDLPSLNTVAQLDIQLQQFKDATEWLLDYKGWSEWNG